jgi:hypothetical protein
MKESELRDNFIFALLTYAQDNGGVQDVRNFSPSLVGIDVIGGVYTITRWDHNSPMPSHEYLKNAYTVESLQPMISAYYGLGSIHQEHRGVSGNTGSTAYLKTNSSVYCNLVDSSPSSIQKSHILPWSDSHFVYPGMWSMSDNSIIVLPRSGYYHITVQTHTVSVTAYPHSLNLQLLKYDGHATPDSSLQSIHLGSQRGVDNVLRVSTVFWGAANDKIHIFGQSQQDVRWNPQGDDHELILFLFHAV